MKPIETNARVFLTLNILSIDTVTDVYRLAEKTTEQTLALIDDARCNMDSVELSEASRSFPFSCRLCWEKFKTTAEVLHHISLSHQGKFKIHILHIKLQ